jgi:DNA-binding NtrC family response regulator
MNVANVPHRVCIVDDEAGVRELLRLMCESIALEVSTFDSAETFLAGSGSSDWDLMLLDIDMPGMGGLELLETLRRRGLSQPVVMISGAQDEARVSRARQLGAADFFGKPFNLAELRQCIHDLLGGGGREPAAAPKASAADQVPATARTTAAARVRREARAQPPPPPMKS